ncbi:aldehyde ferredoxin oxidoreductase family protein [Chloroflexota bacterium]
MTEWYGWAGTILDIDLTTRKVTKVPLSKEWAKKYIGGSGFGARILYDELKPGIDPLGPENIVLVGQGPLSGTIVPGCGRYEVMSKSPQTGIYARSNGGGFFGPEMKWAGYDLMIIRGMADKPVYIYVEDDLVELRDAGHLWGKDTWATQRMIREELGDPDIQTLTIGPAGENLSLASCIIGDLSRAAGKVAFGAIWGSKKLKAIAARGSKGVNVANKEGLTRICREVAERFKQDPVYEVHSTKGTTGWVSDPFTKVSIYGVKAMGNLTSDSFMKDCFDNTLACFGCPVHCSHYYTVKSGKYKGVHGEGLEANAVVYGGALLDINNAAFVCKYNTMCNQLGLHIDTPGMAIHWAFKLYQDGIITKEDTDGLELVWGDEDVVTELVRKIAYREGIGDILQAYPNSADRIGKGAELYISHVKGAPHQSAGMDLSFGFALELSVSTRGRDHLTGLAGELDTPTGVDKITDELLARTGKEKYGDSNMFLEPWSDSLAKAHEIYDNENAHMICDQLGTCKILGNHGFYFGGFQMSDFARMLSMVTGVDFSEQDLVKSSERELLLERLFNAREGIRRVDDYPHAFHWLKKHGEPHPRYDYKTFPMTIEQYDRMLDEYYKWRGCDLETGIPTKEKLAEVGLGDVAADMTKRGTPPTIKTPGKQRRKGRTTA